MSLPDISSTEIAPNKVNQPSSKIININHIRGLQYYQKQLAKNSMAGGNNGAGEAGLGQSHMLIDELGGNTVAPP